MAEIPEYPTSSSEAPYRGDSLFDWEVSVARARERASALRSTAATERTVDAEASEAAYNELALSYEELTVAQEELRAMNEQVTESAARVEQERLRYHELFVAAPVPYLVTDANGTIREANHAASQLLRLARERLQGKPLVVFARGEARRRLRDAILLRCVGPGTSSVRFNLAPRESPSIFAEATLSSVADASGAVREIRWLIIDRTRAAQEARARRRRAVELNQLVALRTAELEEAQRVKDRLVATVSHEFRTGLAAIGGYAELLELGIHGALSEPQLSDIRRIRRAYEHLGLVVDDLLSYGKIVAGRLSVELDDVELGEAVRGLVELLAPQARDRNIEIELHEPRAAIIVRADPERLRQILLNVAGNAIKFSPSDSRIVIRWRTDAGTAVAEIIDTGPGIPKESREAVFEPFSRLENSRTIPGTGLGLAISRELARAMGGELAVDMNPAGQGSSFALRLPRSMPLAPQEPSAQ